MEKKFFVTIVAKDKQKVRFLKHYDYDLFREALRSREKKKFTIEGLLTLAQIERLVGDGYRVTINKESSGLARGRLQVIDFKTWLNEMEE